MKKNLAIVALFFCSILANAQLYYRSGTFLVQNAKKQVFYPGVQGSPINTTITFQMVFKKCVKIEMDSFWMDGFSDAINIRYKNGNAWDGKPMKGDTLLVSLTHYRSTAMPILGDENNPDLTGSRECSPPMAHKGEALFRYKMKSKTYYFSIKNVEKVDSVYAP